MARLNTKRMMNILASDKKKMEAAEIAKTAPPTPELKEATPMMNLDMKPHELEQWLTDFLQIARDADRRYQAAVAAEEHPNSAIQDILHAAELAPSMLDPEETLRQLTALRRSRRALKQELEVTDLWKEWATANKPALDKLTTLLGNIRKVMNRQPNDAYRFKTGVIGIQGEFMQTDPKEDNNEDS